MALLSAALDDFSVLCSDSDCDLAFGDFGAFAAGEVGFFLPPPAGPLGSLPGPPPPRRRRRAAGEADAGKTRGNYNCSKCGQPKRGHVCVFRDGPRAEADKTAGVRRAEPSKRKAGTAAAEADEQPAAPDRRVRRKPAAAQSSGAEKRNAVTPVTPALGSRGEAKRPPRKLDLLHTPVAAGFAAGRLHDYRLSSGSRSGRRKPSVLVTLPPLPPPRLALPVRHAVPALLPFPGVFNSSDDAWLRVFSLLPVETLAAAACVSRRFRWLSRRVLLATVEATLVLRTSKSAPESVVAGVLRSAPALRVLELIASACAPLTDAICARVARAAAPQLASIRLSVAPGGANLVTGAGVAALAAAPDVTALQLEDAVAVTSLSLHSPRLRRFALRGAVHLSSIVLDCPSLAALDLDLSASEELLSLPRRAVSAVDSRSTSSLARDALAGCPALCSLSLLVPGCGDSVAAAIAAAPCAKTLRALALPQAGLAFTDAGVSAVVSACTALESFELSGAPAITDAALQSIAAGTFADKLVSLAICGCPGISRGAVSTALPALPSLRALDIAHSLIAPAVTLAPPRKRAASMHTAAQAASQPGVLVLPSASLRCLSLNGCTAVSSLRLDCVGLRALGLRGAAVQDVEFVGPTPQLRLLVGADTLLGMRLGFHEAAPHAMHASASDALANSWKELATI